MCCLYTHIIHCRWASEKCANAKLLMKIDDDTLLRTKQLPRLREMVHRFIDSRRPVYAGKK